MRKILILLLVALMAMPMDAQKASTKKTTKKTATTQRQKKKGGTKTTYTNSNIQKMQRERSDIQKSIKKQEQALRTNKADVEKRLNDLMRLNGEIVERQKNIDGIQTDINNLDGNIDILNSQLETLQKQLDDRQQKYVKSMRYMQKYGHLQDKLMFIFSAKNFAQMYRRLRFVKEYANFQRAQGEALKAKQRQVNEKHAQLKDIRSQKNTLLYKGQRERSTLQSQQDEQKQVVSSLKKQQKVIQKIIDEQKQKDAVLNSKIDQLIQQEVEKARQRAAAEAKKKAEAAAEAKRRAEEVARKKAAAEAAARENARRIAEAKAREQKAREEARAAALAAQKAEQQRREAAEAAAQAARQKKEAAAVEKAKKAAQAQAAAERQARAEQAAREAQVAREAAERKAQAESQRSKREIAEAQEKSEAASKMSTVDRMMTGGFAANKGRLPMPISGKYKIVSHFGQYNVEGLEHVTLDNKGINILGSPGCVARAIYDGEVSAVFGYSGTMVVMVRHGVYISVYCNRSSVSVSNGQKVRTGQTLGAVASNNILQFQLRKETAKLNPESWLGR